MEVRCGRRRGFRGRPGRTIGAMTVAPRSLVAAIDQGTTSRRCILFDHAGQPVASHQLEHAQITPRPGWVEHDADEILERVRTCVRVALRDVGADARALARRDGVVERLKRFDACLRGHRQVAVERKLLAVHTGGHERQQHRRWTHQRYDANAGAMSGGNQERAGVGDSGTAGVGKQSQILSIECRLQQLGHAIRQRVDVKRCKIDRLYRLLRLQGLDELAGSLGRFDHKML